MKIRLPVVLIPALATVAFAAPAAAATSESEAVSENWAGYEATTTNASGFSAASGSWVVPTVKSTKAGTYSAYWVGLGGGGENSSALEQEGTQANVSSTGKVSYYAWYELVPSAPVRVDLAVHPGDRVWARTAVSGDRVTVEIDNKTTGRSYTKTLTMTKATPDTSTAEWVAEAPSECQGGATGQCTPLPLADFGTVKFSNAYATSAGQTKSISGWTSQAIALSPESASNFGYGGGYGGGFGTGFDSQDTSSSSEGAAPGSLSSDGTSFTVTYGSQVSATSGSSSTGYGSSGYGSSGYGSSSYGSSGYGASGYGSSGVSGYGYGGYGYGASGYGDSGYGGYGDSGYVVTVGPGGYSVGYLTRLLRAQQPAVTGQSALSAAYFRGAGITSL